MLTTAICQAMSGRNAPLCLRMDGISQRAGRRCDLKAFFHRGDTEKNSFDISCAAGATNVIKLGVSAPRR